MYNNCFKWVKLKSSKPQNAVVGLHEALLCTFYSFPCPVLRMDSILICNLPTVAYPMISTTSVWHPYLCIVLLIIPNVELTFFDTSAHCLEGRAWSLSCPFPPHSRSKLYPLPFYQRTICVFSHTHHWAVSTLKSIFHSCDHLNILHRSFRSRPMCDFSSSPTALPTIKL